MLKWHICGLTAKSMVSEQENRTRRLCFFMENKLNPLMTDSCFFCSYQDDQLRDIIDCSREIEETYGHLFDFVLVNNDLNQAFVELLNEINRIEMEPQWVPASWIGS